MRSNKLAPALAATAVLFALAPAAWAHRAGHKHASANGNCRISIDVAPRLVTTGEATSVFGRLKCANPASAAGQTVTVYQHSAGAGGFSVIGSPVTEATGAYQLPTGALHTNSVFYVRSVSARSNDKAVKVAAQVTLSGPADGSQLLTGGGGSPASRAQNKVTFTGTVSPANAGATVALQREASTGNEEWIRIDHGVVDGTGKYAISHVFIRPGDASIRVVVRPGRHAGNVAGASQSFSYEISEPQNPQLTINTSADPISYGQSVTISGTAAGAANQSVTLLSRAPGGPLVPVATGKTNASGEYSFPQTPLQNTIYKVTAAGTSSSSLFEGVKFVLTAVASATTVSAGQPITFSGSVLPTEVGHVIYLERKNVSNVGFHVVQTGVVSGASTYTIVHSFFSAGTGVFRIAIPGDPDHQRRASEAFTITVTPAPASLLRPEAPGNSKQPSEGQV
jgi:hypothetical protein